MSSTDNAISPGTAPDTFDFMSEWVLQPSKLTDHPVESTSTTAAQGTMRTPTSLDIESFSNTNGGNLLFGGPKQRTVFADVTNAVANSYNATSGGNSKLSPITPVCDEQRTSTAVGENGPSTRAHPHSKRRSPTTIEEEESHHHHDDEQQQHHRQQIRSFHNSSSDGDEVIFGTSDAIFIAPRVESSPSGSTAERQSQNRISSAGLTQATPVSKRPTAAAGVTSPLVTGESPSHILDGVLRSALDTPGRSVQRMERAPPSPFKVTAPSEHDPVMPTSAAAFSNAVFSDLQAQAVPFQSQQQQQRVVMMQQHQQQQPQRERPQFRDLSQASSSEWFQRIQERAQVPVRHDRNAGSRHDDRSGSTSPISAPSPTFPTFAGAHGSRGSGTTSAAPSSISVSAENTPSSLVGTPGQPLQMPSLPSTMICVVEFKMQRKHRFRCPSSINIEVGQYVVVHIDQGSIRDAGLCVGLYPQNQRHLIPKGNGANSISGAVVRAANEEDCTLINSVLPDMEEKALQACHQMVHFLHLPFVCLDAEYQFDTKSVKIYYELAPQQSTSITPNVARLQRELGFRLKARVFLEQLVSVQTPSSSTSDQQQHQQA